MAMEFYNFSYRTINSWKIYYKILYHIISSSALYLALILNRLGLRILPKLSLAP
jgi:hypothetical protein